MKIIDYDRFDPRSLEMFDWNFDSFVLLLIYIPQLILTFDWSPQINMMDAVI